VRAHRFTNLTLEIADGDGAAPVVVLRGELDLEDAAAVDAALAELQRRAAGLVLDLRELTFMDSSGTRALWAAHQRASDAGGTLRVVVAPGAVRRTLAVTGLDGELDLLEHGASENGSASRRAPP
jgi:anti-sigma B factor antagonist